MSATATIAPFATGRTTYSAFTRWLTHSSIILADYLGITMAGSLAVIIRYLFHAKFVPTDYLSFTPSILIFFITFAFSGLYPGIPTSPIEEFRLVLRASSVAFLLLVGTTVFLREGVFSSRIVFVLAWLLTIIFVPLSRRIVRGWCSNQSWWGIPTVIIGDLEAGQMILGLLRGHRRVGLRPVALVIEDGQGTSRVTQMDPGVRFSGGFADSSRLASEYRNCYAIIAMPTSGSDRVRQVFNEYAQHYRRVLIIPDLFGIRSLSVAAKDICGVLSLELDQRLTLFFPRLIKRCFDLGVSTTLALFLSPLLLFLCAAVRFTSRGPIFYGQQRIGKNQQIFKVWKFRTMVVNADAVLQSHLDADPALREEWERDHKLKRDPRVTWVGRLLRKSSLDELPQLWNVICGEMSLVGPRPITHSEGARYGESLGQYLRVMPGVTGLWQISGRNDTTYELRTRIDDYYVRNWSLYLDMYIVFQHIQDHSLFRRRILNRRSPIDQNAILIQRSNQGENNDHDSGNICEHPRT